MYIVCVHELLWDSFHRHSHVFISVKGGFQIKILDIDTYVMRPQGGDYDVLKQFGGYEIRCASGNTPWLINEVATHNDSDPIGVVFLDPEVIHNTCVCNVTVFRYVLYFFQGHELNCIFSSCCTIYLR